MIHRLVSDLFTDCPFLQDHLEAEHFDLPTVVFGGVARLLIEGRLPAGQEDSVFRCLNAMAETRDAETLEILGTGAIELFNDNAEAQRFARAKLTGPAREILENFRLAWGQPDYGPDK